MQLQMYGKRILFRITVAFYRKTAQVNRHGTQQFITQQECTQYVGSKYLTRLPIFLLHTQIHFILHNAHLL
jgi:hypothetical protein